MANSRIMLTCKHCGEQLVLGKGYFGSYFTQNEKMYERLNDFFEKHRMGECSEDIDCSDDAKNHFVILEEGDALDVISDLPTADVVEVKHGEWIAVPSSDMSTGKAYKCSECGKFRFGVRLPPYCQECGAKMDGEKVTE